MQRNNGREEKSRQALERLLLLELQTKRSHKKALEKAIKRQEKA